jgi:NAD(P)-dependent dehydrogenase (short-subunit alcohol dehydrogenase family)
VVSFVYLSIEAHTMNEMSQKIALITGANKGIGFEVARQLGKAGLIVLVGSRDAGIGENAAATLRVENLDARLMHLDVTREESVEAAAASIETQFGRLDVLVNNAGINDPADGPPSSADPTAVEHVMQTNFLGAFRVTRAVLPLLKKAAAARIVNVSSGLGSLTLNGDPAWAHASVKLLGYCASKAAMNMLTVQLAYELLGTAIKVNSANPGYTATALNGFRGTQTIEQGSVAVVRLALLPSDGPTGGSFDANGPQPW